MEESLWFTHNPGGKWYFPGNAGCLKCPAEPAAWADRGQAGEDDIKAVNMFVSAVGRGDVGGHRSRGLTPSCLMVKHEPAYMWKTEALSSGLLKRRKSHMKWKKSILTCLNFVQWLTVSFQSHTVFSSLLITQTFFFQALFTARPQSRSTQTHADGFVSAAPEMSEFMFLNSKFKLY